MIAPNRKHYLPVKVDPSWTPKEVIQLFHRKILWGDYEPCYHCSGTGVRSYVDASGNNDRDDCRVCDGWSVLRVVKNEVIY